MPEACVVRVVRYINFIPGRWKLYHKDGADMESSTQICFFVVRLVEGDNVTGDIKYVRLGED